MRKDALGIPFALLLVCFNLVSFAHANETKTALLKIDGIT